MKKVSIFIAVLFVFVGALTVAYAPDILSVLIICIMFVASALGFFFGMNPTMQFSDAFRWAQKSIERVMEVQTSTPWIAVRQIDDFFHQSTLDGMFAAYGRKVEEQREKGEIVSDIEEFINEDSLALRSWQGVVTQIPGTLTALGLLGTFLGLIIGIAGLGFSSVEAALVSVEILVEGIKTAFYTSIVGVIFSVMFNITYKLLWNAMLREMGLFMESFHLNILPSSVEQARSLQHREMQQVLERLDRIPKDKGFSLSNGGSAVKALDSGSEQRLMPEIRNGLNAGEFTFHVQPKCDLATRKIVGGEVLMRWNHGKMGVVPPAAFLPIVEKNGFIVRLDCYIWEEVFKTIRRWIDEGNRPVPLAVNVSKTDILAMDVTAFFTNMAQKYRIPPRYLEVEVTRSAFTDGSDTVRELEEKLRQSGFRLIIDGFNGDFADMHILKDASVDALKLDLRYMEAKAGKEAEAVQEIFTTAQKLNFPLLAEGIENAEMLSTLRRCGCTEGQGYYLHKPMTIEEFEEILN